jgi:hypothetical protein
MAYSVTTIKRKAGEQPAELTTLVYQFEQAEEASQDAREDAEKSRDYYDGYQWTDEEIAALNKRKQPVITVNRIRPKVQFLLGFERQNRKQPKAWPRTPAHEQDAEAATDSIRYVLDANDFDCIRSDAFENLIVDGICGVDIGVVPKDGEWCIELRPIAWDRLFYDPYSRKKDFSDATYLGGITWMDESQVLERWPDAKEIFDATIGSESKTGLSDTYEDKPVRWSDPKRKRVRVVDMWRRERGTVWHYIFTRAGILESKESPYENEYGEKEWGLELQSCFVDRDGNRYGIVKDWRPIQEEINKRRSKALHLLSVRQVKGEKGAVEDVNKARAELARPDGYIEVTPGMAFDVLPTGDMAEAQFSLLQEAKNEIDAVGVNAALSGKDGRDMSGRALLARQESGLAELGPEFDKLRQWELRVYRKIWNRIRQYWTGEKWIRVTDDERNLKWVGLNQPITRLEQLVREAEQNGQPIPPEQLQMMRQDPAMQEIVGTAAEVARLDVDITIDQVPDTAAAQQEQFLQLAEMAKSGVPIPPDALIEASSLRDKDKILEKMQGGGEKNPEVMQLQQALQEAQAQLAELSQAHQHEQEKLEIERYKAETDRMQATRQTAVAPENPTEIEFKRREFDLKERELALKEMEMRMEERRMLIEAGLKTPEQESEESERAESDQQRLAELQAGYEAKIQSLMQFIDPTKRAIAYDDSGRVAGLEIAGQFFPARRDGQGRIVGLQ